MKIHIHGGILHFSSRPLGKMGELDSSTSEMYFAPGEHKQNLFYLKHISLCAQFTPFPLLYAHANTLEKLDYIIFVCIFDTDC